MTNVIECDLLVIGSGPAGEGAALCGAMNGLRVVVVESGDVGGNCTHKGTIPSKALRHAVRKVIQGNTNSIFRLIGEPARYGFSDVMRLASQAVSRQAVRKTGKFVSQTGIKYIRGHAAFKGATLAEVKLDSRSSHEYGSSAEVRFKHAVIATGSRPYRPDGVDFNHSRILDSDTVLEMNHSPKRVIIYGAGVIGCEYASIFSGLGIAVDLINTRDQLLSFLDSEISSALSYHLSAGSVVIKHNEQFDSISATDSGVTLKLKSGKEVRGDVLVWCNGRTGNSDNLGLEAIGVKYDSRGQVAVDKAYRTSMPNVYAAGDIIGWPSLASASYDQGRAAIDGLLGITDQWQVMDVPTGIYTIPEISSVGKTSEELTADKVPYEVGTAYFGDLARAQISDELVGMLKVLFHSKTLEVLGVHCFGYQASEIIHIGQSIMRQPAPQNSLMYFARTTFNYPTMAEAYRVAALDGLARLNR